MRKEIEMRIGKLAREAGVTVDTVRFYERRGLLVPPSRTLSDYRDYSQRTLDRLRFIRESKGLGFTLNEIRELFRLRVTRAVDCEALKAGAVRKITEIDRKILQLRRMRHVLRRLARDCETRTKTEECPILRALDRASGG